MPTLQRWAPKAAHGETSGELLQRAVESAGNTKVIIAGGEEYAREELLKNIKDQLDNGGTAGAAIGRNIFQHTLKDAVNLATEIAELVYTQNK